MEIEHLCEICDERIGKQDTESGFWLGDRAPFICDVCNIDLAERQMAGEQ